MFGLFKPKPPLSPWEKAWTESTLLQLLERFGSAPLLDSPTLVQDYAGIPVPTDQDSANELLEFIKQWMRADFPAHLKFYSDAQNIDLQSSPPKNSLEIEVHEKLFEDHSLLFAVIARQIANQMLEGSNATPWVVDLCPAYFGLGIFAANATLRAKPKSDGLSWWTTRQQGYLPSRIFGYALVLRAILRGESTEWRTSLRQDAFVTYEDGEKYIEKTGDTVFCRDMLTQPRSDLSADAIIQELQNASPSRKILAIWEIQRRELNDRTKQKVGDSLLDCMRDREAELRAVAATSLPNFLKNAETAQDLCDALRDRDEFVRIAAADALAGYVGIDDESIIYELTEALKDDVRLVVFNAASSLTSYGKAAQPALKPLLKRFRRSLNECRDADSRTLLAAIDAIADDAIATLNEYFGDTDAEYLEFAIELHSEVCQRTSP